MCDITTIIIDTCDVITYDLRSMYADCDAVMYADCDDELLYTMR